MQIFLNILIPFLLLLAAGAVCALILTVATAKFGVQENQRMGELRDALPGANCGACGFSGCDAYAKALDGGQTDKINLCVPGGDGTAKELAAIMGTKAEDVVEMVAYVACNGSCRPEEKKYVYDGIKTCKAANTLWQGDNFCNFACLGYGDCLKVCPRDAICIGEAGIASIDPRKCIGCGLCAKECPNNIIHIVKDTTRVVVTCNNHYKGAQVRLYCKNGCIACGKCEKNCPTGAITVVDNLATIDYDKCISCGKCHDVCPVGCIHEESFICGAHFE